VKVVRGEVHLTHRLAWAWANSSLDENGPVIPEGMHVLHHCDNPPCVNPAPDWTLQEFEANCHDVIDGRVIIPGLTKLELDQSVLFALCRTLAIVSRHLGL